MKKLSKQDIAKLDDVELKELEQKITGASKNLKELEKRLFGENEKVKRILAEFETTKKKVHIARQKHKEHKKQYDEYVQVAKPKIEKNAKKIKSYGKRPRSRTF